MDINFNNKSYYKIRVASHYESNPFPIPLIYAFFRFSIEEMRFCHIERERNRICGRIEVSESILAMKSDPFNVGI